MSRSPVHIPFTGPIAKAYITQVEELSSLIVYWPMFCARYEFLGSFYALI